MSRLRGELVGMPVDADYLNGRRGDVESLGSAPIGAATPGDISPAHALRGRLGWAPALREVLIQALSLWRDFMGDSAYQRYLEHHGRNHPDHPPLSEKEFWRARAQFAEENVSTGCC